MENIIFCAVEMATITVSFFKIILRLSIFKSWHYFSLFSRNFQFHFSKEQVNLKLLVLAQLLKKWELTDIPGHDGKLTSDKSLILTS